MSSHASSSRCSQALPSTLLTVALGLGIGCSAPVEGGAQNQGALPGSQTTLRSDRFSLATGIVAGGTSSSPSVAAPKTTPTTSQGTSAGTAGVFTTTVAPPPPTVQGTWGLPPPPEGPPPAALSALHSLAASFLVDLANGALQGAVSKTNEKASLYSVSASYQTASPYMLATQYGDRPNELYANIPFDITYGIFIEPVGPSLVITQSSNIQVSCAGWQTGSGTVTEQIVFDSPYFDPEQYNNLVTGAVQPQIEAALGQLPLGPRTIWSGTTPCGTLGAYTNAQDGNAGDEIVFDDPAVQRPSLLAPISVSVLQVRRLFADQGGVPEYAAVETPYLQLWANETSISLSFPPMTEGQTYVPSNAIVQTNPVGDQLVVIADMNYSGVELPIGQTDATFVAFDRSSSFGNGPLTMQTPKSWTEIGPIPPGGTKPNVIPVTTGGYELTLQVSVPPTLLPGVLAAQ